MRKFDSGRLYKLIKGLVIVISVISLLLAINSYRQIGYVQKTYVKELDNCNKIYGNQDAIMCLSSWNDYLRTFNNWMSTFFLVGIGLPIVFFGGCLVYKYVFPVKEKATKE
jgi:hypothetical protein